MPRTNQIPYLSPARRTPGATYHWKPSPRLRREGFVNERLGTDYAVAAAAAIAKNDAVDRWLVVNAAATPDIPRRAPPRVLRWRDLVAAYRADPAFLDLKPKSRAEYDSRLRTLDAWALGGALRLDDLGRDMVVQLRNTLVKDPRKHRTAALLRVLRILVNFAAGQGWLARGIASDIDIPEPGSRRTIVSPADVDRLAAAAEGAGRPSLALAIHLGFWTFQRESDLLALTRFQWREMQDVSGFARRVLAGPDGTVMGFRLQQGKTDAWVHVAPPPPLRAAVDARIAALDGQEAYLVGRPPFIDGHDRAVDAIGGSGAPWPAWSFQRAFRALCDGLGLPHVQFRDLRRSGMVMFGELAVPLPMITAASGHTVLGNKRTILDTYMPGNARIAAEGAALAWSRWLERQQQEKETHDRQA